MILHYSVPILVVLVLTLVAMLRPKPAHAAIHMDFSDVPDFEPLPTGAYILVCTGVEEKPGKEYPYLNWEFTVEGGEYDGRKIWEKTSLSPKAKFRIRDLMVAFGEDASGEMDIEPEDYIGRRIEAGVIQEPYTKNNGEPGITNKIESAQPA